MWRIKDTFPLVPLRNVLVEQIQSPDEDFLITVRLPSGKSALIAPYFLEDAGDELPAILESNK